MAFHELALRPEQIVVISGIGCNGRFPHGFETYGFHTLHGRVLPIAQGINIANPSLTIVGIAGDGDAFSIGGGHVPHAARRNPDFVYIVLDNGIYAQTKGQPSPTTPFGFKTKVTPFGNQDDPIDICKLALAYNVSFLARGFSGKPNHLANLIAQGIRHKGFALIHVLNPCTTFHDTWKEYTNLVEEIHPDHDPESYDAAWKLLSKSNRIPIGIIFREQKRTLEERLGVSAENRLDLKSILASFR
jgi:2-oxoglutarate ferredoxin oxidoreductase subunit beta